MLNTNNTVVPSRKKGESGALETYVVPTLHVEHVVLLNAMVERSRGDEKRLQ